MTGSPAPSLCVGVVDGKAQHVDAHTRTQDGGSDEALVQRTQTGNAGEQPTPPRTEVIVVSGFGEGQSAVVLPEVEELRRANPSVAIQTFAWDERSRIEQAISQAKAQGVRIVLIGYSYGGDTVAQIAAARRRNDRIDIVITLDPVGRGISPRFLDRARQGAGVWYNVLALGNNDPSDDLARFGGQYGEAPAGHADSHIRAPLAHNQFSRMLRQTEPISGRTLLDIMLK